MPHTFIILDGHPNAFIPTQRIDNTISPTHQLPPLPLWACMVQGTIEFCRVAWDIEQSKKNTINVMVAGGSAVCLNNSSQQSIRILQQQFPLVQPRQAYTHDRLQPTIELALSKYLEEVTETDILKRCRIVLVTLAKQPNEKSFEFRNNPEDPIRDIRSMLYESLQKMNKNHKINHVQVDILRLLPYDSTTAKLPNKITSKQISTDLTMSVYSIPNGKDDLKYAMRHLSQLYYNINLLHISNIPMKSAENTQSTQTVTLYYQANGKHLINQQEPLLNSFIHDPKYLKYRELRLVYAKRSKRALPESEWCTCMHSISPIKLHDLATEVYLGMTFKGSISYLVTHETSLSYTHILMAQDSGIFLHCLNSQLQSQFSECEHSSIGLVGTSTTYEPKTREMMDTLIRPNLFETVHTFLSDPHQSRTIPLNPFRFSHHLPIMTLNEKGLCTSPWIEKSTRWRTCFRDCEGTDKFPITADTHRPIADLAIDVLNGNPSSSGYGIAFGLMHDLLEQLQDVLLKQAIAQKDILNTENLINLIVSQLVNGVTGKSQKMFIKGITKEDAKVLSKKLMVGLYLVGKRFMKDSEIHEQLCKYLLHTIDTNSELSSSSTTTTITTTKDEKEPIKSEEALDNVWGQVNRYENMSLREKEDAAQGYLPDFKSEEHTTAAAAFSGQLPPMIPKVNPNFKSRRSNNNNNNPQQQQQQQQTSQPNYNRNNRYNPPPPPSSSTHKYPDPASAVPYLTYIAPTLEEKALEERQEEEALGNRGNLLWLYWMNDKVKKRGNNEEGDLSSGTELVYKNHQWKRIKKEFLGRTAQPGEKGETI
ncbi:hypothetical protein BD770DRAFT_396558 [Pilaira anomala]|nr:hypothetical protein BD770DRAFT_396558 [Pilaira anomala]